MEIENFNIKKYSNEEAVWDKFVMEEAINGTFLHTRRFLNYHPKDRFQDASFLIFHKKGNLAAICSGCKIIEDGQKVFYSHLGSTFGGIVIAPHYYKAQSVIEIIEMVENFLKAEGYRQIVMKLTSDLLAKRKGDLLKYCFYYEKYEIFDELSLYIDFADYKENILSNFEQGKRTNVNNCMKENLQLRKIQSYQEMEEFYEVLEKNLQRHNRKPVHTIEELMDFKNIRLQNECEFWGAFKGQELVAGSMMFYFHNVRVAHTQYLCSKAEYNKLSPMTYIYYSMILKAKERGFEKLSWGITTENYGKELNFGLTRSKEAFGSKYSISYTVSKNFEE